jgi:lysophospholipase L1-like esterase
MIGGERAFWNLGIGYGTATSAASDGVWLLKAKQSDTVFVCYGVNDINSFHTADEVIADISTIIDKLRLAKCKIILKTVPPFDYPAEKKAVWCEVNERIKKDLSRKVDLTFDCVPLLSIGGARSEVTRYGGHPNAEGCAVWAEELWRAVKPLFEVK